MELKIALAGNPNCGKTTLFNALTGSNQYVGNWPGVTVEKKEGKMKKYEDVIITDLPGIYSLSPYTPEEVVARNYLVGERPNAILNIVDGTNLERNLYLTTQLMEIGIPVVIAINMMDVVRKNGDHLDTDELSRKLGCPITEISALKGDGILAAAELAIEAAKRGIPSPSYSFSGVVEHALAHIEEAAVHGMPEERQRWYAVKIFERDEHVLRELDFSEEKRAHIENDIKKVETRLDDDAEAIIINERYVYITELLKSCYKRKNEGRLSVSDKIDRVLTNRVLALPIFAAIMFLVYYIAIGSVGNWTVDFMNDTLFGTWIVPAVAGGLEALACPPWLISLLADGVVGGVGAVLGFVPQMMILFLLLSLLEDCGYMSRVAFIMDKLFRKFGLSGKSFIPLLVASGCGVPGVMASRTIEQERDRRITIMTTCFIPCGAKMPIVGLIAGALFADSWLGGAWVATLAYFIGVGAVVVSGIILKKCKLFAGKPAPFVMELPAYHAPVASNVLRTTWERGWDFIKRAGTLIFAASVIIWTLNSLSFEGGFHYITPETGGASILALIGNALAWLFVPLGFGNWQSAVATILGLLAKEQVVGTFGTLSSMANADAALGGDATAYAVIAKEFFGNSGAAGLSFMIFNLLCAPCVAAMGAIKREMNSPRFTALAIGYMCVFAYAASFVVYRLGVLFTAPLTLANGIGGGLALLVVALAVFLMARRGADAE
ncbi:MAG: ferrous iron transport protein B [Clostridia bacterium]|nr:ferrous iron transport protein B [Clostridia bacterium]